MIGRAVVNPRATTAERHATATARTSQESSPATAAPAPRRSAARHYIGIAPQANLVSVKVADDDGNATVLDVIYGLQFVVDHKADYNIRVVNLSLESTDRSPCGTDPLDAAAEAAWFDGIVVVAAAGNRGTPPTASSLRARQRPVRDHRRRARRQGTADTARRRGSELVQPRRRRRTATRSPTSTPPARTSSRRWRPPARSPHCAPTCVVSGEYFRAGGTSMSAPVVSRRGRTRARAQAQT